MRDRRDNFLLYNHSAADGAMRAFGQSRFRTRRIYRFVDHLGMRDRCNQLRIAAAAHRASVGHLAFLLTCRLFDNFDRVSMRSHWNALRIAVAAARASVGHLAFLLACRLLRLLAHIVVRDRRDNYLLDEHSAADRAFPPLREARFRAGRRNGGDYFRRVRGKFAVLRVTYRTLRLADASRQAAAVGGFVHFYPTANARLPMIYTVRKPLISRCMYNMPGGGFDDIFTNRAFDGIIFARLIPIGDMRSDLRPCATFCTNMPMILVI